MKINRNRIYIGLFLTSFLSIVIDMSMSIALSKIVKNLVGDSGTLFGLLSTIFFIGNIIMLFPLTKLSDRLGPQKTLIISFTIAAFGIFLLYFGVNKYWTILFLRFIIGLNSIQGVISALVCDHFPKKERGKPLSVYSIGLVAGYLIGSLIGGPIYSLFGDKNTFLILGGIAILCIVNITINIQDTPKKVNNFKKEKITQNLAYKIQAILKNPNIKAVLVLNFFNMLVFTGSSSYAVFILFNHFNLPEISGGLYLIPVQLIEIVMFVVLGSRVKQFDKTYKFLIGIIIILTGFGISFIFFEHPIQFSLMSIFFAISIVILMQSADTIGHGLVSSEHKTTLTGIYRTAGLLGSILGPIIFGFLADYIWIYSPGFFFVIGLILVEMLYWKRIVKKPLRLIEISTLFHY